MDKHYDRDRIFDENRRSEFLWCLHCERTYNRGRFRKVGDLQMCPYEDCDGDTVIDAWDWEDVREQHPDYPAVPQDDVVYPLYTPAATGENRKDLQAPDVVDDIPAHLSEMFGPTIDSTVRYVHRAGQKSARNSIGTDDELDARLKRRSKTLQSQH